ncbi:hypothetical protein [Azorhizophilus paspali]|uniref:Uncharacterized protein n=1 Tax=Azorhizophilus paspali TaxID=69963 RepID=A0ABV6SNU6_AZOPA
MPQDERFVGQPLGGGFVGTLRLDREQAITVLLRFDTGIDRFRQDGLSAAALIARRGIDTLVHRTELLRY